jgi:plastocyanin domain-containing protein
MNNTFYSLQDFMLHSKSVTYVLMGIGLVGLLLWWLFLTGRDEGMRRY